MCSSANEDKVFERQIKLEKGKTSYWIGIIDKRYVHSIKLSWTVTLKPEKPLHHTQSFESTNNLSTLPHTLQGIQCLYTRVCMYMSRLFFNVTMCIHIHIVIRCISSHLNHIPVEPLNVPMKSLNVWNEEIFCKVLGEYTTTVAMKEDIQRDIVIYIPY